MANAKYKINIQVKRGINFSFHRKWIKEIIIAGLNKEKVNKPVELDCLITDDAFIHRLNKKHRGIDKPTDILSFALNEPSDHANDVIFPAESGLTINLGSIVISYERALEQAAKLHNSIEQELTLLFVHGTLHLLGYDHESEPDARKMRSREKSIIQSIIKSSLK